MGCCLSTKNPKPKSESSQLQNQKASTFTQSRAPPPSSEEDTVVKEVVISVTQTPLNKPEVKEGEISISEISKSKPILEEQDESSKRVPNFTKIKDTHLLCNNKAKSFLNNCTTPTDLSEVSEICSESVSVSTATRDHIDFEEVRSRRQRAVTSRSPATGGRNRVGVGKSPNRRSDQSPARRNGSGYNNPGMVKRVGSKHGSEQGESSGRMRSRSPAATNRSVVMGRSQSLVVKRNNNKSPGRVRPSGQAKNRKVEEGCGNNNNGVSCGNESIENPLVSLECFIFL